MWVQNMLNREQCQVFARSSTYLNCIIVLYNASVVVCWGKGGGWCCELSHSSNTSINLFSRFGALHTRVLVWYKERLGNVAGDAEGANPELWGWQMPRAANGSNMVMNHEASARVRTTLFS
jgi:hypothetical protein